MRFDVVAAVSTDVTTPPQFLNLPAIAPLPAATTTRKLVLAELTSNQGWDVPVEVRLGTADSAGNYEVQKWMDPVTENPAVGVTEISEFYNATVDAHPMHIHEVAFEVINRQAITITDQNMEAGTGIVGLVAGTEREPEPWELGRKDTVIALPGEVTRVKASKSGVDVPDYCGQGSGSTEFYPCESGSVYCGNIPCKEYSRNDCHVCIEFRHDNGRL